MDGNLSRFAARLASTPAAPPALAVLVGTALGRLAPFAPPGPLILLAALGLALAATDRRVRDDRPGPLLLRTAGLAVAALAAGFLNGHVRGGPPEWVPERARPVTAVVETTGHWLRFDSERQETWSAPARVLSLRQGDRVAGPGNRFAPVYLHVAADEAPGPFGARFRVKGFFDRPVRLGNPRPREVPGPWRLKVKSARLVTLEEGPGWIERRAGALRRRVERALAEAGGGSGAGGGLGLPLARALVLGDASDVPEPAKRALRRLGLAHLLAVSGLHVGLVAGVVLLLATPLPGPAAGSPAWRRWWATSSWSVPGLRSCGRRSWSAWGWRRSWRNAHPAPGTPWRWRPPCWSSTGRRRWRSRGSSSRWGRRGGCWSWRRRSARRGRRAGSSAGSPGGRWTPWR